MSAPFAVYGAALGGSCRQVKLELNRRELAETEPAPVASTTVHHSPSCAHSIGTSGDLAS